MKFGEKLADLRAKKHLTQSEVAAAAGVSRRNYISYETEGRYPRNREIYYKLALTLGCDVNYLLTEDEEFVAKASEEYGEKGKFEAEELVDRLVELLKSGELTQEEKDSVMHALTDAYFQCKAEKYKTEKDKRN